MNGFKLLEVDVSSFIGHIYLVHLSSIITYLPSIFLNGQGLDLNSGTLAILPEKVDYVLLQFRFAKRA